MHNLLTVIVAWLSVNYGLPATTDMPQVRFAPPMEIAFLHYEAFTPEAQAQVVAAYRDLPPGKRREVVSAYDTRRDTILLPEGWTSQTPAQLSMLVHETVHHLQTTAGLRYACPEEREALAYSAQEDWLRLFGTSLEREFAIDSFTLLAITHCGF